MAIVANHPAAENRGLARAKGRQYLYALLVAIALVALVDVCTNETPPKWDALYYVDMAENGLVGNPGLVAPFAYRPGMPWLSGAISGLLGLSIGDGFKVVGWVSALCFLMAVFALAFHFTADYRRALVPMVLLGLTFSHIKFPLFFYTLVDVAAYPLMVLAFWALVTRRFRLCLLVSVVGVLFKEFLVVPLILLLIQLGRDFWRTRSKAALAQLAVALALGACAILVPRFCIPISGTYQFIDPINDPATLKNLIFAPLDGRRIVNIVYAIVGYWLPTLVLVTRSRFKAIWAELKAYDALAMGGLYLALVLLLTLYGGTNISVFVSYSVAVQVVVLALLLRHGVSLGEIIYAIVVTLVYNKIWSPIPSPDISFNAYVDFYGGWAPLVSGNTLMRMIECGAFIGMSVLVRGFTVRLPLPSSELK